MIVTALAQIAVSLRSGHSLLIEDTIHVEAKLCLRVYAITERNKLFGGALSAMIITQLSFGTYLIVENARGSGELPQLFISLCHVLIGS